MLQRVAVARARQLLANSDLTIAQVAEQCGYSHLPHFGALFRKLTGTTPAAFREASGWTDVTLSPTPVLEDYRPSR